MAASAAQSDLPIAIEFAQDQLQVVLSVRSGQTLKPLDAPNILARLAELRVKIDSRGEAEVHEFCRPRKGDRAPVVVARGTAPIDDAPARLELLTPFDAALPRAVKIDEPIARILPPGRGRDGRDVFGQTIPRRLADPIPPVGMNLRLSSDRQSFVAAIDGMLRVRGHRPASQVSVVPAVRHSGNLNASDGPLEFSGDIVIEGHVTAGAIVRAGASIQIGGDLEATEVIAAADLFVAGAITGREKTRYNIGGDVLANSIHGVVIDAGGDVTVRTFVNSSRIVCGGMLKVQGGALVSSHVIAGGGVECQTLGSPSNSKTLIEVGLDDRLRRFSQTALPEIESRQAKAARIRAAVEPLLRNTASLTSEQKDRATRLLREAEELDECARTLGTGLRKEYEAALARCRNEIAVATIAYPGITLRFPGVETTLRLAQKGPCRIVSQPCDGVLLILVYEFGKTTGVPLERRQTDDDWLTTVKLAAG